eukprot:snap_masked-scaffold_13-processed-gene-11.58-mRNA-1 protein AED:1.00 eAED:1.00 QI:0/0/0/0/1/1/2/0/90
MIVVKRSLILPVVVHTHLRFNHGAVDQEKKWISANYPMNSQEVKKLFTEARKKLKSQCLHSQRPSRVITRPLAINELPNQCRAVLISDYL